jgi:predicted phosphodiesterase
MKLAIGRAVVAAIVLAGAATYGCSSDPADSSGAERAESSGSIGLALEVSDDITLNSVSYSIAGPAAYSKSGTINLKDSSTLSLFIDGIPAGAGYNIALSASGSDGQSSCTGNADFVVTAGSLSNVSVKLQCKLAPRKGSIMVNGTLNVCPVVESLEANPAEVAVGGSIELSALGSDADSGPSALSYAWSATSGTLLNAGTPKATFTCGAVGPAVISLSLSDGDTCPDVRKVSVNCSEVSTDKNLKVAMVGDTDHYANYQHVLELVKSEGAQALLVNGDMTYSSNPTAFWDMTDSVLGADFPVFIARGNHDDDSWPSFQPRALSHLGGAERIAGAHDSNYKTIFHGLSVVAIRKGDTADKISSLLKDDPHAWKICQWHQNQKTMQVGGKSDEMGWGVYEACRQAGAIIQTGHEHSYERTRTLIDTSTQTVDPSCNSATDLCVGPGRTFVTVTGLGGSSVRPQLLCLPSTFPYGCKGEWGSIYTSNQGATYGVQFMTFNVNGSPKKAKGYFKDLNGVTADQFSVTYDAAH